MREKPKPTDDRDAVVERLTGVLQFNCMTGNQVERQIGVRDTAIYSWLQGISKPRSTTIARIIAFLQSLPAERAAGITPTGYQIQAVPDATLNGLDLARSVARPEARFEKRGLLFKVRARIAGPPGQGARATMTRYERGMGKDESRLDSDSERKVLES